MNTSIATTLLGNISVFFFLRILLKEELNTERNKQAKSFPIVISWSYYIPVS